MSTQVWGELPKSQTDDETIEEAIYRIVGEHEDNPEAHTGSNQSLEVHRTYEVIDHVPGSVLMDKNTQTEDVTELNFESLESLSILGTVQNSDGPRAALYLESGEVDLSEFSTTLVFGEDYMDFAKDMLFQFTAVNLCDGSDLQAAFIFGTYDAGGDHHGFGFVWDGADVKGFCEGDSATNYTAAFDTDATKVHVYRVQWVAALKTCYFYVDGVLKGTKIISVVAGSLEPNIVGHAETDGTISGFVVVRRLKVSVQQIVPAAESSPPPESSSPPPESSSPPPESSSPPPAGTNTKSLQLVSASAQDVHRSSNLGVGTGAVTVELWFKPSTDPSGVYFWLFDLTNDTNDVSYALRYSDQIDSPNYTLSAERAKKFVDVDGANYNVQLDTDTWYHLAVVFTGSLLQLWLATGGGSHSKVAESSASGSGSGSNADNFYIGSLRHLGNYANGLFDDVRVWSEARSGTQLDDNFETELEGTETNLAAYYKFADDLTDGTSHGNDLSENGSPSYSEDLPF